MTSRLDNFILSLQSLHQCSGWDIRFPMNDYTKGYRDAMNRIEEAFEREFKVTIGSRLMKLAERGKY